MLETSLSLIADQAARRLSGPKPLPAGRLLFDTDFDAGAVPAEAMAKPSFSDVPCSYADMVFHLPPGLSRQEANRDAVALSGLLPIFRTLFDRHKNLMPGPRRQSETDRKGSQWIAGFRRQVFRQGTRGAGQNEGQFLAGL